MAQCELHEVAKLTASDGYRDDYFGYPVSVSGDVAIMGASWDDCAAGSNCGSAYIYRYNGTNWIQQIKLAHSDAAAFDHFGSSVAVSGDVVVVGAYADDCPGAGDCGSVYVYRYNGSTWVLEQKLTASDAAASDLFGWSVSVSGDAAIVGAFGDDCAAGSDCGSVYVYRFNGSNWVEQGKLTASDGAQGDRFGHSVSVSGDVAVVGAPYGNCVAGGDCGSAYVYRFNGSSWVQQAKLTALDAAPGDQFGHSVSVSGDIVVVGTTSDDCAAGSNCGSAYVYRFTGGTWVEEAKLTALNATQNDYFGRSVSASGDTAIVGAQQSAYVYRFNPGTPGHWILRAMPVASDGDFYDSFGTGVSVSGNTAVVGASYDDCTVQGSTFLGCGSAYVFALENVLFDCNSNGIPDETDIAGGTSQDCDANGVPDECDILSCPGDLARDDCNANIMPDGCDIASGTSPDCNLNGTPDECDPQADCNNNGTQDICDVAGSSSLDCNGDEVPDECQLALNDCNGNLIPDGCESSTDCNNNTIRDICDIAAGTSEDCNANVVPDECDLADGTSTDVNNNGIPDECDTDLPPFIIENPTDVTACGPETVVFRVVVGGMTPLMYQWRKDIVDLNGETADTLTLSGVTMADVGDYDVVVTNDLGATTSDPATLSIAPFSEFILAPAPDGVPRNRYIGVVPPSIPCAVAIRVRLISLQHPDPPNDPPFPPRDYSAYEFGPGCTDPSGCVRWVGAPGMHLEVQDIPTFGTFQAASLQCTPHYQDWSDVGFFSVTGAEIIPSSLYEVEVFSASCTGNEDTCTNFSPPLQIATARWGDIAERRNPPSPAAQPDVIDIAWLVNKLKAFPGALSNTVVQLQPNVPYIDTDVNALDISLCVNAVKGFAYPFSGPCPCPSLVTCNTTACTSSSQCTSPYGPGTLCIKTCVGGPKEGERCISHQTCRVCEGGSADGRQCYSNSHCPGGICLTAPVCSSSSGFCHDACGRCTP